MNIFLEALIVGIAVGILGFIISTCMMYMTKNFTIKKYNFWWQVMLSFFFTGFLFHLICQISGINKWYCKHGKACKK
jgi:H+/Cl- antiporter ClcA